MNVGLIGLILLILAIAVGFITNINTGIISIVLAFAFTFLLGSGVTKGMEKDFEKAAGFKMADVGKTVDTKTYDKAFKDYQSASKDSSIKSFDSPKAFQEFVTAFSSYSTGAKNLYTKWPTKLFLTILGMTLMFSVARANGSLEWIARKSASLAMGHNKFVPIIFFAFATVLALIGPGNIATCALVLPIALMVAVEEKINPVLMASCVIGGSNAGGLSPFCPTGIIAQNLSTKYFPQLQAAASAAGVHTLDKFANADAFGSYMVNDIFVQMIIAQIIIVLVGYVVLKGYKIPSTTRGGAVFSQKLNDKQTKTITVIGAVVAVLVIFPILKVLHMTTITVDIGLAGFTGALILLFLKTAEQKEVIAGAPWNTLVMICGVGVLIGAVSEVGGISYLSFLLQKVINPTTSGFIFTIMGGILSTVSSASGVVMPTLFPLATDTYVHGLAGAPQQIFSPITLFFAITLGAHVTTNSPLSTLGGLAIASAGPEIDKNKMFLHLFAFAFGGLILGGLLILFGIVGWQI